MKQIGIIGFGRIGSYLHKRIQENQELEVTFIYEPIVEKVKEVEQKLIVESPEDIPSRRADLVVESADFRVVKDYAPEILKNSDMLILSVTALADKPLSEKLHKICTENSTRMFIPHGALLGMDGLYDARETLTDAQVITRKHPRNIDFSFTDDFDREDIAEETVLYDGVTRGICSKYPRNVNAHAVVALSGIGFDRTRSKLISDPNSDDALQHIIATGGGTVLEIKRSSAIKGVTGEYTLVSLYGSVLRALTDSKGLNIV